MTDQVVVNRLVAPDRSAHAGRPRRRRLAGGIAGAGLSIVLLIWTTLLALVVILQITAMTKRILRAIDLASRK